MILDAGLMKFNGTEIVPELKSLMTDRNYDWECLSNRIVLEINLRSKCATQVPIWMLKPPLKSLTTLFFSWLCKMLLGSLSFSLFHKLTCLMRINALKQTSSRQLEAYFFFYSRLSK